MPTLKIKPEYAVKLRTLGVYDKWVANMKAQWADFGRFRNLSSRPTWITFIETSFMWSQTAEGHDFWADIADR